MEIDVDHHKCPFEKGPPVPMSKEVTSGNDVTDHETSNEYKHQKQAQTKKITEYFATMRNAMDRALIRECQHCHASQVLHKTNSDEASFCERCTEDTRDPPI